MKVKLPYINGCFEDFKTEDIVENNIEFELLDPTEETYTHEQALEHVKDKPYRLITKREIHLLIAVGILKKGDVSFWSSSVVSFNRGYAWRFFGSFGNVDYIYRSNDFAVRCVAPVGE